MWIQTSKNTKRLKLPEFDAVVEFSDNGTAQVSEKVGTELIDRFDSITEYNPD